MIELVSPLKHRNVKKSSVFGRSPFLVEPIPFPPETPELFVTGPEAVDELDE